MFNGYKKKGFGGNKGGKRPFSRDFEPKEMHQAVCSECDKDCEVPFRPNGRKPVLCRDCFKQDGGMEERPSFREKRPFRETRSYESRDNHGDRGMKEVTEQLKGINEKLEAILDALTEEQE